jgi:acyl-[acyl-carrier-protein]-phospholipid O-acyltransferase/long-chain-fatty-acid--[acyl-carrier-protein] ligase
MAGYLHPGGDGRVVPPVGGWYGTGDVVRVGPEGHGTRVGRVRRFAKVGGEMVSLAMVEALAAEVWPGEPLGAVALADPRKGERVVLAIARPDASIEALRARARRNGVAEILVPSEVRILPEIPVMASGKTDLPGLKRLLTD